MVVLLMKYGADPNSMDIEGTFLLHATYCLFNNRHFLIG